MDYIPCWEVAGCPPEINQHCAARVDWTVPKTLHAVGDEAARREAKEADQRKTGDAGQKKKRQSSA